MGKKKIVHVVPTFELGGVQTGMLYSLEELNKVYDFKVLVISWVDENWMEDLPPHLKGYIVSTGASNVFTGSFKAYNILKEWKPDVIISSLWKSVSLSASYKFFHRKVKLFSFYHNAFPHHHVGNFFLKLISFFQDGAMADSNETKLFLQNRYQMKKVHVIPYNFLFGENNFQRQAPNPSCIRMVYFGRLIPEKGVDRDIEFCRLCKDAGIPFKFDLYGEGAVEGYAKNNYREMIKKLGLENEVTIKQIIPPTAILEKMYQYDFLLQLSNMEGMALSVVEAMTCGLVPLVTPVGEIGRYSQDGINTIWLEPDFDANLPVLVNKLKNVIGDADAYRTISSAATTTFVNYKKYNEAMEEAIEGSVD